jgi:hypothetical protein
MKKIIILIFLTAFLLMGISVYSQEPSQNPPKPITHSENPSEGINNRSKADNNNTYDSASFHKTPDTPPDYKDANGNATKQDHKTDTNQGILWATIAIAFFALCQVVAMIFQYIAMSNQVKELRESVEATKEMVGISNQSLFTSGNQSHHMAIAAQAAKRSADNVSKIERAYVFTTVEQHPNTCYPFHGGSGHEGIYVFNATVKMWNLGRTPAVITKIRAVITLEKAIIPEIDEFEIPSGIVIGSDGWKNIPTVSTHINETERGNIYDGNIIAYCCGRIGYRDVFHGKYIRGFCWEYSPCDSRPTEPWIISDKYKDLNYEKQQNEEN